MLRSRHRAWGYLAPWPRPSGVPSVGWSFKALRYLQPPSALAFILPQGNPPPCASFSAKPQTPNPKPQTICSLSWTFINRYTLDVRQWSGCVLAEVSRTAPREWRETAQRFQVPDRLRAPRRGADMEPGYTRTAAGKQRKARGSVNQIRTAAPPCTGDRKTVFQIVRDNQKKAPPETSGARHHMTVGEPVKWRYSRTCRQYLRCKPRGPVPHRT